MRRSPAAHTLTHTLTAGFHYEGAEFAPRRLRLSFGLCATLARAKLGLQLARSLQVAADELALHARPEAWEKA